MKDAFAHFPGVNVRRQYEGYSVYQEALWDALDDVYQARVFGFEHTRMPTPGMVFNESRFRAWQNKMLNQSKIEATRDNGTRGFTDEDLTQPAMLYLYERMVAADPHKNVLVDD